MDTNFDPFKELFQQMVQDIQEIKKDVKELNAFKFKLFGAAAILGILGGGITELVVVWLQK